MAELNDWRNELSTEHNMLIGVTFTDADRDRVTIRLGPGHNAPGLEKYCNGNFMRAVTLLQFNPSSAYLTDQTGLREQGRGPQAAGMSERDRLRTARVVVILDAHKSGRRGKEEWIANGERLQDPGPFNTSTLPQLRNFVASATGICLKQLIQAGGFNAADQAEAVTALNEADVLWVVRGSVCR
eukprot:gene25246-30816_t